MTGNLIQLRKFIQRVERERGPFTLLALFQRREGFGLLDFVVAAEWIDKGSRLEAMRYLAAAISADFTQEEVLTLARILPLQISDANVRGTIETLKHTEMPVYVRAPAVFAGENLDGGVILIASDPATRVPLQAVDG